MVIWRMVLSPGLFPDIKELPPIDVKFADKSNIVDGQFMPYLRNKDTLARPWAKPGTENLEHRIGGIEKEDVTGNVNYDPENHHFMVKTRALKVQNIANELPPTDVFGEKSGDLLILSWGGTQGACRSATEALVNDGKKVSHIHLRWINPLPNDLGELLIKFKHVLIPEINLGQLIKIIRAEYLIDAIGLNKVKGKPISSAEIQDNVKKILEK